METLIPDLQRELSEYLTINELVYQCQLEQWDVEIKEVLLKNDFWSKLFKRDVSSDVKKLSLNIKRYVLVLSLLISTKIIKENKHKCDDNDPCGYFIKNYTLSGKVTYGSEKYPAHEDPLKPHFERAQQSLQSSVKENDIYLSLYLMDKIPDKTTDEYFNRVYDVIYQAAKIGRINFLDPLVRKITNIKPQAFIPMSYLMEGALIGGNKKCIMWILERFDVLDESNDREFDLSIFNLIANRTTTVEELEFILSLKPKGYELDFMSFVQLMTCSLSSLDYNKHLFPWILERAGPNFPWNLELVEDDEFPEQYRIYRESLGLE
jgi:hypothetical protein